MRRIRTAVMAVCLAAALFVPAALAGHGSVPAGALCKSGYYKNVSGKCIHRPVHASAAPAGATAECRDGTYSFSQHASGTCSHHGGVKIWIHHP